MSGPGANNKSLHAAFAPAVAMMNRLKYPQKFAVITLLFVLPLGLVMSLLATVLVLVFFVTSGDSATLVLGMMSSGGDPNPSNRLKVLWGVMVAGIAVSLLLAGGLAGLQTATIVFALPFTLVIVLMSVALLRAVREDYKEEERRERALRQRMRHMMAQ